MPKLSAIKEMRYAGQNYLPGAPFEASDKDAKLLIAIGKAKAYEAPKMPKHAAVEAPGEPKVQPDETAQLRDAYFKTTGRKAFMGWDADRLRAKIHDYNTRDMRAR